MEYKKNRIVVCFNDRQDNQSALENLNGYCCNLNYCPIQIQVLEIRGIINIFAILEKIY